MTISKKKIKEHKDFLRKEKRKVKGGTLGPEWLYVLTDVIHYAEDLEKSLERMKASVLPSVKPGMEIQDAEFVT